MGFFLVFFCINDKLKCIGDPIQAATNHIECDFDKMLLNGLDSNSPDRHHMSTIRIS